MSRLRGSCAVVDSGLGRVPSVRVVTEERVEPRERQRASSDHGTRRHGAPQDVRAGKFPNRQETGYDRHEEADARHPEGQPPDPLGIQEAASRRASFGVLRIVCHGFSLSLAGRLLSLPTSRARPRCSIARSQVEMLQRF